MVLMHTNNNSSIPVNVLVKGRLSHLEKSIAAWEEVAATTKDPARYQCAIWNLERFLSEAAALETKLVETAETLAGLR